LCVNNFGIGEKPRGFNFFSFVRNQNDNSVQTSKLRKESMLSMAFKSDSSQKRKKEIRDLTTAASEGFEIIWIKEEYYRRERNNMSSEVLSSNVIPFAGSGLAAYTALRDISIRMLYQKASQYRSFRETN